MLMNKWVRAGLALALIVVGLGAAYVYYSNQAPPANTISISQLGQDLRSGTVKSISEDGLTITIKYNNGTTAKTTNSVTDKSIEDTLINLGVPPAKIAGVDITYDQPSTWSNLLPVLLGILPLIFVGALLFFMLRRAQ